MARNDHHYNVAATAFRNEWGPLSDGDWEPFWFKSANQLELHHRGTRRLARLNLSPYGVPTIILNFEPRDDESAGTPSAYSVTLNRSTSKLTVKYGANTKEVGLSIDGAAQPIDVEVDTAQRSRKESRLQVSMGNAQVRSVTLPYLDAAISDASEVARIDLISATVATSAMPGEVAISGECRIVDLGNSSATRLTIHGPAASLAFGREPKSNVSRISGSRQIIAMSFGDVVFDPPESSTLQLEPHCRLRADQISAGQILISQASILEILGSSRDIEVNGKGRLEITTGEAQGVSFGVKRDWGTPVLTLAPYAVLQDASGRVRLGTCAHAQLNGAEGAGLTIETIDQPPDVDPVTEGVLIRNFRVPVTLGGMQTLGLLTASAAVAIPLLAPGLPGSVDSPRFSRKAVAATVATGWKLWRRQARTSSETHMEADYAAALARLAEEKGAPGSVRTRLNWLAYRMRQESSTGRTEHGTLAAYRLIGYGERAGPPFIIYGGLVALAAFLSLADRAWDLSWSGFCEVISMLLKWASAPLHVFRLSDSQAIDLGNSGWVLSGKVAITVAFVVGFLALRKYVKRVKSDD